MSIRWPHSEEVIALGMVLLAASLTDRHIGEVTWFGWADGWLGSVMVIVGTGKLFF